LQKFVSGRFSFSDAVDVVVESGGDNIQVKKLEKFRKWITSEEFDAGLRKLTDSMKANVRYELDKIASKVVATQKKLK
jgi:hypothetical protein